MGKIQVRSDYCSSIPVIGSIPVFKRTATIVRVAPVVCGDPTDRTTHRSTTTWAEYKLSR